MKVVLFVAMALVCWLYSAHRIALLEERIYAMEEEHKAFYQRVEIYLNDWAEKFEGDL